MSLHNFCRTFFQTCISHYVCEKFQVYEKLQFLEDALSSQNIDCRYFYSYAATSPLLFSLSALQSQATMTWNIRLFYMICNFSIVMTLQFCKYIAFCHIAW